MLLGLYQNQAVKRNMDRFPDDFCFQLTKSEYNILKSQIVTSRLIEHGGDRKLPYVFTEEGVAMLSSCLHTKIAKIVSVDIMRAFVTMKKYISSNLIEQKYINTLVLEDHDRYFILDDSVVYHCGASINRIGYKTFSINLIGDEYISKTLINKVSKIK